MQNNKKCKRKCTFPPKAELGGALPSPFSSLTVNKCPMRGLVSATFWCLFCLTSLCNMAPKHSAKVEKTHVLLPKLCSDISRSAVGHESVLLIHQYIVDP